MIPCLINCLVLLALTTLLPSPALGAAPASAPSPDSAPSSAISPATAAVKIQVGSKSFTESVILGDIATRMAEATGAAVEHRRELGGTRLLWNALVRGELDVYPDYTGC